MIGGLTKDGVDRPKVFGSFWAVFVLANLIGETESISSLLLGSLMGAIVVAPFFVLAWSAGRWPRRTGVVLLSVAGLFLLVFVPVWAARSFKLVSVLVTATLLIVPLVASGIALLREDPLPTPSDGADEAPGGSSSVDRTAPSVAGSS